MPTTSNYFNIVKLPAALVVALSIPLVFGDSVPMEIKSFFYSVSMTMKYLLLSITPLIALIFIFSSLLSFRVGVIRFVVMLVIAVFLSNFVAICSGFMVASSTIMRLPLLYHAPLTELGALKPLWEVPSTKLVSNERMILLGFILGIVFSVKRSTFAESAAAKMNAAATMFLKYIFVPLLPLFILGMAFKLEAEQTLLKSLKIYGSVLFIIVGTQICYVTALYMIAANFSLKQFFYYIRNILPATITGFATISSIATMPVLIIATEKNTNDESAARSIIPAVINTHTIGSALGLILLSYATLLTFHYPLPAGKALLCFAFYYAIAKFAVVGVPGGVLVIISPLLENYLGFTTEMVALITAIYMLIDPFGTAANVTGNGAFAIIFTKLYKLVVRQQRFELFRTQHDYKL